MPIFKEIPARKAIDVFLNTEGAMLFYASGLTKGEIVSIKPEQVLLGMFKDNSLWHFYVPYELHELPISVHGHNMTSFREVLRILCHDPSVLRDTHYEVIIREVPSVKVITQESVKEFSDGQIR